MKRFMITLLCLLAAACPPIALCAQNLQMLVDGGKSTAVRLEDLHVDVKVTGNIAATTWTMIFKNSSNRLLEGELTFPLPEGITVSHYAIDINGKLRDAVPVEKAKGTTVLEAIEQRRVDPGLLERVEGNAFRTRIYPLPANGSRTVVIGYEEILHSANSKLTYRLPLIFDREIPLLNISVESFQNEKPENVNSKVAELSFDRQGAMWKATKELHNFAATEPLVFNIPQKRVPTLLMQASGNHYYCLINAPAISGSRTRVLNDDVTILWDASLSGLRRNHDAELELLDGYFKRLGSATVHLFTFSNTVSPVRTFSVGDGDWHALKEALQRVTYDGGTQLGKLDLRQLPGKEFLLFSDGLNTYGGHDLTASAKPVFCISAATQADYALLRTVAAQTGGTLIDLTKTFSTQALEQLLLQPLQLLGIKADKDIQEVFPNTPVPANAGASISAVSYKDHGEITIQYGYGNQVTEAKTLRIDTDQKAQDADISRIWALQKIAALDGQYEQNKAVVESLGKRFGLVTRNTSLIVLENLDDYLRYEIEPPAELRDAYDRVLKERGQQRAMAIQNRISGAEGTFNNLLLWWKQLPAMDIPASKVPLQVSTQHAPDGQSGIKGTLRDERGDPIINANVVVTEGGILKGRDLTDFDGNYNVHPLSGGHYDVKFTYQGRDLIITGAVAASDQVITVNGRMNTARELTQRGKKVQAEVHATRVYTAPIIDPENPGGRQVKTAEQIEKAPARNVANISALTTQVYNGGSGGSLQIGGGRISQARVIVDGVQLPPSSAFFTNQDPSSVETISSFSSGTPAHYGSESDRIIDEASPLFGIGEGRRRRKAALQPVVEQEIISRYVPDKSMLDNLLSQPRELQYQRYLALREKRLQIPSFYFQVAGYFIATNRKDTGIRILSNLAELELENYELYKMLGYKLREMDETEAALEAFRKVLTWRPMDPQSKRDVGLALEDAGFTKAALDTLYSAMTSDVDPSLQSADAGIDETLLCDINGILAAHPDSAISVIPRSLIQAIPADVRVIINWNMKNTDIDLWVTDPNGEKCYYSHNRTAIGGRISRDITQGFGPEQFLLRKAIPGTYKVEVNYFGDRQVKIAGPTAVMAEIFTGWGTPRQKRQIIALQMKPGDLGGVLVGEFIFGRHL